MTTLTKQALAAKFEIISELGRGGMAIVYKAIQKNLNRTVALKIINQQVALDSEAIVKFHQEAQLAASLSHPSIVHIYDEGEENGIHYISMEFLEGADLHSIIKKEGTLSIDKIVRFIAPIADALDYAHQNNLIHRDIKSANIIITNDGRAVLTDFGIAVAVKGTVHYKTIELMGTPEYMSPEQVSDLPIDWRIDLYALGVVIYECISGKVPFSATNHLVTISKIKNEHPPQLNNNTPLWMNAIVTKLLMKNPQERFQRGRDVSESLLSESLKIGVTVTNHNYNISINRKYSSEWHLNNSEDINEKKTQNNLTAGNTNVSQTNDSLLKLIVGLIIVISIFLIIVLVKNNSSQEQYDANLMQSNVNQNPSFYGSGNSQNSQMSINNNTSDYDIDQSAVGAESHNQTSILDYPDINSYTAVDKLPEIQYGAIPVYPDIAKNEGITGEVFVKTLIDNEGKPKRAVVIKSDSELLNQSAIDAAMQSTFIPALANQQPIAVWIILPYRFTLDGM